MGKTIDGKKIADGILKGIKEEVSSLKRGGLIPRLTVIVVGDDPASAVYVKNKEKAAEKLGIESTVLKYPADVTQEAVLKKITELNCDTKNHGILVQLPLPKHFNPEKVLTAIDPAKDVDGFHPMNMGRLLAGAPCLMPCTPAGVIRLIESTGIDIAGKNAVVVGRSNIVGKPVAIMLLQRHATVTICHSKTVDLPKHINEADIFVSAIGRPGFVKGEWIKKGAVVIDVGINRTASGLTGDVEYEAAKRRAAFITPVPGGVGPMTIAMLMKNTVEATRGEQ